MLSVKMVLMVLAIICFFCAAIGVYQPPAGSPPRFSLMAIGLCLWALATIVTV